MFGFGKKKSPPIPANPIPGWINLAIAGTEEERKAARASLRAEKRSAVSFFIFQFLNSRPSIRSDVWALARELSAGDPVAFLRPVVESLSVDERYRIAKKLGETGSHTVTPVLLLLLEAPDPAGTLGGRQAAVWALANIKDPAASPHLRRALRDRDCNVGVGALAALIAIEPQSATDLLCDVLADTSLDPYLRNSAANKLRDLERTARVLEVLETAAQDKNQEVSNSASLALGRPKPDTFFHDLPRAIDIRRGDWVGLPIHVNPATCSDSAFIPVPPGTYGLVRVEYVQGQPWLILAQGSFQYKIDGGDFRVYWPDV